MTKADRWIGLFLVLFSLYVCLESLKLGLGTYHRPGSGFFSFYGALVLGLLALALTVLSWRRETEKGGAWGSWDKILLVILALFGFTLLLEWLGFLPTTFLFIGVLLRIIERRSWIFSLSAALLITAASYVVFDLWLKAQLPAGILGK
ncbi:MAG: tripartite tricarboxylate transporter TctB family protein [Candidatus Tectomicrobia bacterium]|uniref:Tripartite tricarboxylate transporter TctB family protein n=1 Tax=Tectimicrobiota bacterium TaxID=2528274 RepID=A0A932GQX4_UNCTE|nr:tripartite tricarboxylate transporter TctB family protein [Candidatus Tectomicrobia bacterium]